MPVVLYDISNPPNFLKNSGHWCSDFDNKCCGSVSSLPENFEVQVLTKEEFVNRIVEIHKIAPFAKGIGEDPFEQVEYISDTDILVHAEMWYTHLNNNN